MSINNVDKFENKRQITWHQSAYEMFITKVLSKLTIVSAPILHLFIVSQCSMVRLS